MPITTLTEIVVSLDYPEYIMLLDALRDKKAYICFELEKMNQIVKCQDDLGTREHALNCINYLKEDLRVVSALAEKIKINSKPGGMKG